MWKTGTVFKLFIDYINYISWDLFFSGICLRGVSLLLHVLFFYQLVGYNRHASGYRTPKSVQLNSVQSILWNLSNSLGSSEYLFQELPLSLCLTMMNYLQAHSYKKLLWSKYCVWDNWHTIISTNVMFVFLQVNCCYVRRAQYTSTYMKMGQIVAPVGNLYAQTSRLLSLMMILLQMIM